MTVSIDLSNQRPVDVRCRCGWTGRAPEQLVENMGTSKLLCPSCLSDFFQKSAPTSMEMKAQNR